MTHPLEYIHPRNLKHLSKYLQGLVEGRLWIKIIVGLILGIGLGFLLGPAPDLVSRDIAETIGEWLALPGLFFLAVIQMIVVPLVFASIIRGLASSESIQQLQQLGVRVLSYFLITTVIAIILGIFIGYTVNPGDYLSMSPEVTGQVNEVQVAENLENEDLSLKDLPGSIISVIPENPLGSMLNTEMLQIVIFSLIIGIGLVSLAPAQSKPMLDLLGSIQDVCMTIVKWLMRLAPYAVFGLIARVTINTGPEVLIGLGVYAVTVIGGMVALMIVYMLIVFFVAGRNPIKFLSQARETLLLAFSVNSSAVVMPLSIKTAEEKMKVRPSIAQFVVPIGATVNMGGSALYLGLATIFLAQVFGIELSIGALIALILTVVGASIGTPATPGVGIVILATVLTSAGVPLAGITLIMGLDRVLEMFRTTLNVTGDLVGCTVMERIMPAEKTYEQAMSEEVQKEQVRQQTGDDVITDEQLQGSAN
jgi:Na+/H+-dicarboxylate symporter